MSVMKKSVDGLLFYEDFSDPNSLMWTLSPSHLSQFIEFGKNGPIDTEKGLRIKHNKKYITFTINEPADRDFYGCVVDLHHVPLNFEDIGGVIVISSNQHYAECQTYLATGDSAIGNSEYYYNDIQRMIDDTVDNRYKYVTYTFDDDEEETTEGSPESDNPEINPEVHTEEEYDEGIEEVLPIHFNPYSVGDYQDIVYRYIKFYKILYKYFFYASPDGINWIEVGNTSFEKSCVIGLFLYGTKDKYLRTNGFFKCNSFAIYTSKYIYINGIDTKKEFEMYYKNKIIFRTDTIKYFHIFSRSNKTTMINTTELPMPIDHLTIRVFDKRDYNLTYATYELTNVYGGDEYTITYDIRVFIEGQEVKTDELFDLGEFHHKPEYLTDNYVRMYIHNYDDELVNDITVSLSKFSPYYGGEEKVYIALSQEGYPIDSLLFDKQVVISHLGPGEGRTIYIKLTQRPIPDYFMTANEYRFKVIIE